MEALRDETERRGVAPPPPKKRGPGAEVYAFMQALTKPSEGAGATSAATSAAISAVVADAGPVRSRALLQVAGAVVEALQRTSSKTKPPAPWDRMGDVEAAHAQLVEVGGDSEALLAHLTAQLQSAPAGGQASLGLADVMQLLVHAASLGVAWVPDGPGAVQVQRHLTAELRAMIRTAAGRGGALGAASEANAAAALGKLQRLAWVPSSALRALRRASAGVDGDDDESDQIELELIDELEERLRRVAELSQTPKWEPSPGGGGGGSGAPPASLPRMAPASRTGPVGSLAELVEALVEPDGPVEVAGMEKVGNTLAQMGSKVMGGFGFLKKATNLLGGQSQRPADAPTMVVLVRTETRTHARTHARTNAFDTPSSLISLSLAPHRMPAVVSIAGDRGRGTARAG